MWLRGHNKAYDIAVQGIAPDPPDRNYGRGIASFFISSGFPDLGRGAADYILKVGGIIQCHDFVNSPTAFSLAVSYMNLCKRRFLSRPLSIIAPASCANSGQNTCERRKVI